MAKHGSNSFAFSFGGTNMTAHIQSINSFDVESIMEDSKSLGDAWAEVLATGAQQVSSPVEVEGLYDDAAGGPDAVFRAARPTGPSSSSSEVIITWGGSKTSTFQAFCTKFSRMVTKNNITRYKATITPTGAVTEA